jgi:hydroxymethylpyrimidine/phosphomethylpyrimidine kinase
MSRPPVVLSIAGYDPSSGAGITADIKTAAAHGCYAVTCMTALTVQSTQGVFGVRPLEPEVVSRTLLALADDFEIAAIRLGMLATGEVAAAVADFLEARRLPNVVVDPVIRSSSGTALLDAGGVEVLRKRLLALSDVITPNIDEAGVLAETAVIGSDRSETVGAGGTVIGAGRSEVVESETVVVGSCGKEDVGSGETDVDHSPRRGGVGELTWDWDLALPQIRQMAVTLHELGAKTVIITGGHLRPANDYLSHRFGDTREQGRGTIQGDVITGDHIESRSTHGTGCAFATALACRLALGESLPQAARSAKEYVQRAIAGAYPLGKGTGPLNHLG